MELKTVLLEDMRPDDNNPRRDFGDIEALAESFKLNKLHPGQPINPPVVMQDGNVYRIRDGERRYRAMLSLGLTECEAIICQGDEADTLVAMLTTDDKLQLNDIERSCGVQQMLALGVDEEIVEQAGKLPKGSARKVRRVHDATDNSTQMSLGQLLAIDEALERGDNEAADAIAACEHDSRSNFSQDWERVSDRYSRLRASQATYDTLKAVCEELGVPLVSKEPKGSVYVVSLYGCSDKTEDEIYDWVKERTVIDGVVIECEEPNLEKYHINITPTAWSPARKLTGKEAEAQSKLNRAKADEGISKKMRAEFVGRYLHEPEKIRHTLDLFASDLVRDDKKLKAFAKLAGVEIEDIEMWTNPYNLAVKWPEVDSMSWETMYSLLYPELKHRDWEAEEAAPQYTALFKALVADGYVPNEHEQALYEACVDYIEN